MQRSTVQPPGGLTLQEDPPWLLLQSTSRMQDPVGHF